MVKRSRALSAMTPLRVLSTAALLGLSSGQSSSQTFPEGGPGNLTPEAAVETRRIIPNMRSDGDETPVLLSPDGRTGVFRTVRGDVAADSISLELFIIHLDRNGKASAARRVFELRSTGLYGELSLNGPAMAVHAYYSRLKWVDNTHIAFLWPDSRGINQVYLTDLSGNVPRPLTNSDRQVMDYAVGRSGQVIYTAESTVPRSGINDAAGFTVPSSSDIYALLNGFYDGSNMFDLLWNSEWFLQEPDGGPAVRLTLGKAVQDKAGYGHLSISPDQRTALVSVGGGAIPPDWSQYKGIFGLALRDAAKGSSQTFTGRNAMRYFVLDLETLKARPLWNAPKGDDRVCWSSNGASILITSTYLPLEEKTPAGRAGLATAVIDVQTGKYQTLAGMPAKGAQISCRFTSPDKAELQWRGDGNKIETLNISRSGGAWGVKRRGQARATPVSFELRESLTSPPSLFTKYSAGKSVEIFDPNPGLLKRYKFGDVKYRSGILPTGETWEAEIYYPVEYINGKLYPLVVQSDYGKYPREVFSLYGFKQVGIGPSMAASNVARLLASRSMFVAQIRVHIPGVLGKMNVEADRNMRAWEALVGDLSRDGLIDKSKVGLSGFSRNGYYVEYALTHSDFPFAAAFAADNYDPSYMTSGFTGWDSSASDSNGGQPFGEGLQAWLKAAPGFNVDRIKTPLFIDVQGGGPVALSWFWEIYSRLRLLERPVELWAMPKLKNGGHNPQNPAQVLAIQHKAIDWFEYWLNGAADRSPGKKPQYANWKELCALQRRVVVTELACERALSE
jgi:hypothetical protein